VRLQQFSTLRRVSKDRGRLADSLQQPASDFGLR
jgi:hypothetical protein